MITEKTEGRRMKHLIEFTRSKSQMMFMCLLLLAHGFMLSEKEMCIVKFLKLKYENFVCILTIRIINSFASITFH